ncbi:MAG: hypothetical protein K2L49_04535, partial [Muribaculaceae bacterium]|nr:hypothetical protein [Muribaculaceae bacterium]
MYRWMMMVAATVCCLALSARDGDAGRNGMALPGYDVPTLALDVPQLRLDAAGWRNAVDAPGYDRAVRIDPSVAYAVSDRIALWDGGGLAGYGSATSYPGLMGVERGGFAVVQQFGPVTLSLDAGVARYGMFRESVTRFSAGGSALWQ